MELRDYQRRAVDSIFHFCENQVGNPCAAIPTGCGKSAVIAYFIMEFMQLNPFAKVAMITHTEDIISQNAKTLKIVWPSAPLGIYSASLGKREARSPIVFGGIASVVGHVEELGFRDVLIVDEAHLISPKDNTMYAKLIKELQTINPDLIIIGFTATPYRLGQGLITDGGILTDICCDMTGMDEYNSFFTEGYLSRLYSKRTSITYEVDKVKKSAGDYNLHDLQKTVDIDELTFRVCTEIIESAVDRSCWLVFAAGIEHAEHVNACLNSMGVLSTVVHSKLGKAECRKRVDAHKRGEFVAIVNNGVLTTGYDHPPIDLIAMLRSTTSPALWVQMCGRGTRPVFAPGFDLSTREGRFAAMASGCKPRGCLVLDFAGNTARLGPVNCVQVPKKKGSKAGDAPVKVCPQCGVMTHASARVCDFCGHEFPKNSKLQMHASDLELIKEGAALPEIKSFNVTKVLYSKHGKKSSPIPTMKVTYCCGLVQFCEYIAFEHGGFPKQKAKLWWAQRLNTPCPDKVDEALEAMRLLKVPKTIRVHVNKAYPEVVGCEF